MGSITVLGTQMIDMVDVKKYRMLGDKLIITLKNGGKVWIDQNREFGSCTIYSAPDVRNQVKKLASITIEGRIRKEAGA
jgi:hypothetical protein